MPLVLHPLGFTHEGLFGLSERDTARHALGATPPHLHILEIHPPLRRLRTHGHRDPPPPPLWPPPAPPPHPQNPPAASATADPWPPPLPPRSGAAARLAWHTD